MADENVNEEPNEEEAAAAEDLPTSDEVANADPVTVAPDNVSGAVVNETPVERGLVDDEEESGEDTSSE